LVGTVDDERGGWSGRLRAPPVGQCGSHRFALLDPAARGIRVERENRSEPELGQISRRRPLREIALSSIVCVGLAVKVTYAEPQSCLRSGLIWENRAKISIEGAGVASCRQVRDNGMASVSQLNLYQCDQCGTANIVAAPVLYQQGTRAYSGTFNSGTSQSFSAQAAAPPSPRGYGRPLLLWGVPTCFTIFWGLAGLGRILDHPKSAATLADAVAILLLLGLVCLGGMVWSFRRVARYNREVYPRLHWDWEHTFFCRRCGKLRSIPS
jgi:hypothetical protein